MDEPRAEWWGGGLADGSLVVLSPSGNALLLSDSSSPSGLQPGAGKVHGSSLREWASARSGVAFPYGKEGHTIGIRRGTLLAAFVLLVAAVSAVNWLIKEVLHLPTLSVAGGSATLALSTLVCILLLALMYVIEVVPLKRRGVQFMDIEEDDDDYLRYVHPAVSSTDEWGTLTRVASQHTPPSGESREVHALLWEAAGIKPTLDAGEIRPEGQSRLAEIALLARGL